MKIQIREGAAHPMTPAERGHVEERLTVTLARFSERIARVVIRLSGGEAGPGGPGTRCRIDVDMRPQTIHVEDEDVDPVAALDRATGRVARAVARLVERDHT